VLAKQAPVPESNLPIKSHRSEGLEAKPYRRKGGDTKMIDARLWNIKLQGKLYCLDLPRTTANNESIHLCDSSSAYGFLLWEVKQKCQWFPKFRMIFSKSFYVVLFFVSFFFKLLFSREAVKVRKIRQTSVSTQIQRNQDELYIYIYIYIYVCVCVCVCIYIYHL